MKVLFRALCLFALAGQAASLAAQPKPAVAASAIAADPGAIPLYPIRRGARPAPQHENWSIVPNQGRSVRNVTLPTLTPVLPAPGQETGAAAIVLPGGGFMALSMDHEGYRVARRLADRGIVAFVLKYRLLPTPADDKEAMREMAMRIAQARRGTASPAPKLENPDATADAVAALAMVRARAAEWRIDPARVGMIGFSAGAITSLEVVLAPPPAPRPAFVGYVYGPQTGVAVPADAPPLFNAIAMDDQLFPSSGFAIAEAWRKVRRPAEVHGYQKGYHGFGLGMPGTTTTLLMEEFIAWLTMQGFLGATPRK